MICPNCGTNLPENSRFCTVCGTAQNAGNSYQPQQDFMYDEPTVSVYGEPVNTVPPQPTYEAPAQPAYGAPAQPAYQAPVQPAYGAPAQPTYEAPAQPAYGAPAQPAYQAPAQPAYQAPAQPAYQASAQTGANLNSQLSMKWYKFLVNFALFAGAVLNFGLAVSYFTGIVYDGDAELVYEFFDGIQGLDIFYGIGLLGMGAFAIYTRVQLVAFKKNGPMLVYVYYALGLILSLIHEVGSLIIVEDTTSRFISIDTSEAVTEVVLLAVFSVLMIALNRVYFKKREQLFVN